MEFARDYCKHCEKETKFIGIKHIKFIDFIVLLSFIPFFVLTSMVVKIDITAILPSFILTGLTEILHWIFKAPDWYCDECGEEFKKK